MASPVQDAAQKVCRVNGCVRRAGDRGMCQRHCEAWRKANPDLVIPQVPRQGECAADGCEKPRHARGYCGAHYYRMFMYGHESGREKNCAVCGKSFRPHGRRKYCETCSPSDDRVARGRLYRYGLTAPEYEALVERQGGRCAICTSPALGAVDHCHKTKKVRGLLCLACNTRLAAVDDPAWLAAATAYVERGEMNG